MANNIFEPLIKSMCECVPIALKGVVKVFDIWGNFIYRIIEGVPYGSVEIKEDDIIQIDNISKYEYIPTEDIEDVAKVNNIVKYFFIEGDKMGIRACIGYTIENDLAVIDILDGHIIVGGASRWGKSNFLNVLITNLIKTYTRNEVCFIGCDYKKSDVYYFRRYNNFIGMSTNKEEFLTQIKFVEDKMQERAIILDKANCRNVVNYNKKNDIKMSYIVFVIDELIQVTFDKECRDKLHSIMSKCASYGIYFILASQDLAKDVIGRCKMNCSQIVGFHTFDDTDSTTLIGKGYNLQDISVKGRCKIKNSDGVNEVQTFYISEEEIENTLKPYEKQKV